MTSYRKLCFLAADSGLACRARECAAARRRRCQSTRSRSTWVATVAQVCRNGRGWCRRSLFFRLNKPPIPGPSRRWSCGCRFCRNRSWRRSREPASTRSARNSSGSTFPMAFCSPASADARSSAPSSLGAAAAWPAGSAALASPLFGLVAVGRG